MPGDYTLGLDWPTCSLDHQKCPSYISRCDLCEKKKKLEINKNKGEGEGEYNKCEYDLIMGEKATFLQS